MKKTRVAWFTSLARDIFSQSSYFTRAVLPELSKRYDIEIFCDRFAGEEDIASSHYLGAFERHAKNPFDIFFYQVENGSRFHFLRTALGLFPGITLFHDYYMTDLGPDPLTNSPWEVVRNKLNGGDDAWPDRKIEFPRSGPDAKREVGLTRVPVFASPRIHNDFTRSYGAEKLSWFLPTPVSDFQCNDSAPQNSTLKIGFCGTPNIEHRAHKVFEAIHAMNSPIELHWLIDESEKGRAEDLLAEFRISNACLYIGRTPEKWSQVLQNASVCIHSHYSVFGTEQPWLGQSMIAKRPCIVTDFADSMFLPDEAVFKIAPGDTEATQIRMVLETIAREPQRFRNSEGRDFVLENMSVKTVADELSLIFERSLPLIEESNGRWKALMSNAQGVLSDEQREVLSGWNREQLKKVYDELGWS